MSPVPVGLVLVYFFDRDAEMVVVGGDRFHNMHVTYNKIAGQSVERLAALSDGIFAVAMTLLVLDLHAPRADSIGTERALWDALAAVVPQLVGYAMSFMTLGIFWTGQQTQLNHLARSNRNLGWIHIGFLFAVSMMPFSTKLLAGFITFRLALVLYWLNILTLGITLLLAWRYARRADLLAAEATPEVERVIERRVLVAQTLYAVGAALCVIDTYVSIGFIVLVQLSYVVPLRFGRAKTG